MIVFVVVLVVVIGEAPKLLFSTAPIWIALNLVAWKALVIRSNYTGLGSQSGAAYLAGRRYKIARL
jgi:hypothetical protein